MANNFGFNLLATAQSVIGRQEYQFIKWLGKTTNALGHDIDEYAETENRLGSVQPIARSKYQKLGLDFSGVYIEIWDVELINLLSRENNSDQVIFNGSTFKAQTGTDWSNSGSWNSVILVRVSNA